MLMIHTGMLGIVVMTGNCENDIKSVASVLNQTGAGGLNIEITTDNVWNCIGTVPVAFFEAGFQLQKSSRFWRHGGRCASSSVFAASSSVFAVKDTRAEAAQSTTHSCPQSSRQGAQSQGEADDPFAQTLAKAEAIRPS